MTDDEADRCWPPVAVVRYPWIKGARFEFRPPSATPPESTVAYMYRKRESGLERARVGIFKGGRWINTKGKPLDEALFWAVMVAEQ